MARRFAVYKGLQRPLIFKGFKGKYIYWGVGCLLAGLVLGALTMTLINMWFGAIVLAAAITGGLLYIAGKQKNGLHEKTSDSHLRLHAPHLKKLQLYVRKKDL
jgi:hypothetical protein